MVNELRSLLHESSENAPHDAFDATALLRAGRSRTRRRRAVVAGAAGLAAAAVIGSTIVLGGTVTDRPAPAGDPTAPVGPVMKLADATRVDLEPLFSQVTEDINEPANRVIDGVAADGVVVLRDGLRSATRVTLVDLESGAEDRLPSAPDRLDWLVAANADQLIYAGGTDALDLGVFVFDRTSRTWSEMRWPGLPDGRLSNLQLGPDGRVYLGVGALDSGAATFTMRLWSASLSDEGDVRDEGLEAGGFGFDESKLVWTEADGNGLVGRVFVRDLDTGEETSFAPPASAHCGLRGGSVEHGVVVLSEDCGTENSVSDERVQVLTLTGEPVVTIRDAGIRGGRDGGGRVIVQGTAPGAAGTYAYDLETSDFVRLSDTESPSFVGGGAVPDGYLLWAETQGRGWVQKLAAAP